MFYKCTHFKIQELVPPETFAMFGEKSWWFIQPQAALMLDKLRDFYNKPITINNWLFGGDRKYSGFRPITCTIGGTYSQHRLGSAFDCIILGIPAEQARQDILNNKTYFKDITCLESDVSWLHFDCRNTLQRIMIVKP